MGFTMKTLAELKVNAGLLLMVILGFGCNQDTSSLSHQDNPLNRGGVGPKPWHFHTGEGYRLIEHVDEETGKVALMQTTCTLDESDPECKEKVYFFAQHEFYETYINPMRRLYEERFRGNSTNTLVPGLALGVCLKVTAASLVAGPVAALPAAACAVGSGIIIGWQGLGMLKNHKLIDNLDRILANEEDYIRRCGHVSRDFLSRLSGVGIVISGFPEEAGQYIPGPEYLSSYAKEQKLVQQALSIAENSNNPTAGRDWFRQRCGQLPSLKPTPADALFAEEWEGVPDQIRAKMLEASDVLSLQSGEPMRFASFPAHMFKDEEIRNAIIAFLDDLITKVQDIDKQGTPIEKHRLELIRAKYHKVFIRSTPSLRSSPAHTTVLMGTDGSEHFAFFEMRWKPVYLIKQQYRLEVGDFFQPLSERDVHR